MWLTDASSNYSPEKLSANANEWDPPRGGSQSSDECLQQATDEAVRVPPGY